MVNKVFDVFLSCYRFGPAVFGGSHGTDAQSTLAVLKIEVASHPSMTWRFWLSRMGLKCRETPGSNECESSYNK
jgi:hypothetical protein